MFENPGGRATAPMPPDADAYAWYHSSWSLSAIAASSSPPVMAHEEGYDV